MPIFKSGNTSSFRVHFPASYVSLAECSSHKGSIWMFPKIAGFPPNHPSLIGFSIINHPFWGVSLFLETPILVMEYLPLIQIDFDWLIIIYQCFTIDFPIIYHLLSICSPLIYHDFVIHLDLPSTNPLSIMIDHSLPLICHCLQLIYHDLDWFKSLYLDLPLIHNYVSWYTITYHWLNIMFHDFPLFTSDFPMI